MTKSGQPPSTWHNRTVVCIASGPSLTREDCELVRLSGLPVVAVNSAWEFAHFCDVVYAGDVEWWKHNINKLTIPAERWGCLHSAESQYGIYRHGHYRQVTNSGARALEFIIDQKPARILMLGFDASIAKGTHCHGDHPKTGNPKKPTCDRWVRIHFPSVAAAALQLGVEVVNCSRDTALTCFPRMPLPEAIAHGLAIRCVDRSNDH